MKTSPGTAQAPVEETGPVAEQGAAQDSIVKTRPGTAQAPVQEPGPAAEQGAGQDSIVNSEDTSRYSSGVDTSRSSTGLSSTGLCIVDKYRRSLRFSCAGRVQAPVLCMV